MNEVSVSGTEEFGGIQHEAILPAYTETFNDDQKCKNIDDLYNLAPDAELLPPQDDESDDDMIDHLITCTSFGDDEEINKQMTFTEEMQQHSSTETRGLYSPRNKKKRRKLKKQKSYSSGSGSKFETVRNLFRIITKRSLLQNANKIRARSELPSFATFCTLEWKNMNVWVGKGKNKKQILHGMNGSISSGQLMAIMGGSGAGKSTLLNILSGRTNLNQQIVSGTFAINKKRFDVSDQSIIRALCSFVPQSDVLCATQTVTEALRFYAQLKLSNKSTDKQMKRINYLMRVLHLAKCKNSMIGDMNESSANKGISGGERRRVSIAAEIINDVDIIFLDEPTSGLDAYTASATIKTLKEFCTVSNKIIIATIHQPSIETFYLFDKLLLLSRGKCCFNSKVKDVDIFFKKALKPKTNPADVIVFEIQQNPDEYAQNWKTSKLNTVEIIKSDAPYVEYTLDDLYNSHNNLTDAPRMFQLKLLLTRELQALYRDKKVSLVRLAQVLFFALTTGVIYYQIKDSYSKKCASFFVLSIIPILFGMVSLLVVFPKQKILFQREYNSNTYSMWMFALCFILIEIPREIIHMLIFNVIIYYLIGFDGDFYKYWINLLLCSFAGGSFGMFFGVICANAAEAAQMVPASLIPLLMFSDGMVPVKDLPGVIRWLTAIDPMYYLFRCFMIIEFKGVTYPRTLTEEDEYVCDRYSKYGSVGALYQRNMTVLNCSVYQMPETPNVPDIVKNISNPLLVPFKTTVENLKNNPWELYGYNSSNFTTTMSEDQQKIEEFCRTDIPASYFFEARNLDPSHLVRYWMIVLAICFIVRMFSLMLLYINNHNDVSITNIFCIMGENICGCGRQLYEEKFENKPKTSEPKVKKQTSKTMSSKTDAANASMLVNYEQQPSDDDEELYQSDNEIQEEPENCRQKTFV